MKSLIAALFIAASLTGCGDSKEVKDNAQAQVILDDVLSSWHSVMPFEPGYRQTGIASFNKEFVVGCSEKMAEAADKLHVMKAKYSDTAVWASKDTMVLNKDVIRWANTCNEIKNKQGW